MKRTKPRASNTRASTQVPSSRNISTQTENFDSFIEVAKLEEQVRVLQLENNVLRKYTRTSNIPDDVVHHKPVYLAPQATSKINTEKSCGCKGNCSTRICGCVKKNYKCNPLCKCDDKMCQNQSLEYNQENKENVYRTDMETPKKQSKKKNDITEERTTNNKGLFSPDMKEGYKDLQESQFSDIHFSFNEDTIIENSKTEHNINNVGLRKKKKQKKEENKEQQESMEKVTFDPMKPRHQLLRTPPNSKKHEKPEVENAIQPLPQSYSETTEEVVIISPPKIQDIKEEEVDWEKHTAQLIPCKKCKRTFLPDRIQKHQACCKKI